MRKSINGVVLTETQQIKFIKKIETLISTMDGYKPDYEFDRETYTKIRQYLTVNRVDVEDLLDCGGFAVNLLELIKTGFKTNHFDSDDLCKALFGA